MSAVTSAAIQATPSGGSGQGRPCLNSTCTFLSPTVSIHVMVLWQNVHSFRFHQFVDLIIEARRPTLAFESAMNKSVSFDTRNR